ncbi:MAG TPA: hypothetical protein VG796_00015 [Verrucomicrobiales bacterium]|nr:hypothetical protein [Verrucomicrobiales bacterium]
MPSKKKTTRKRPGQRRESSPAKPKGSRTAHKAARKTRKASPGRAPRAAPPPPGWKRAAAGIYQKYLAHPPASAGKVRSLTTPGARGGLASIGRAREAARTPQSNVIGFGLSRKRKKGKWSRTKCLTFYVLHKRQPDELEEGEELPKKLYGLKTDVVEIEPPQMIAGEDVLNPGEAVQLASFDNPAHAITGTVGAVLRSKKGKLYLLSNNHVFAQCGHLPPNSPVEWTGPDFPETVAETANAVPLLRPPDKNEVDAALALVLLPELIKNEMAGDVRLASGVPAPAVEGRSVYKLGANGPTTGTIQTTHGVFPLNGPASPSIPVPEVFNFEEVILIKPDPEHAAFCSAGDSGSLLIDRESRRAVGIVMGKAGELGVACPLQPALAKLSVIIKSELSILL